MDSSNVKRLSTAANASDSAKSICGVADSPPICTGARKTRVSGNPDRRLISTSHIERQNLSLRMGNRRFTRLTNAFSKKQENHKHAAAIYFMHYNFCRIHTTLRVTPAMEAGISDHIWSLEEIVGLLA